jgi:hypothetical protein
VLAVRTLLVDDKTALAVALGDVLNLARQVAVGHKPDAPLGQHIRVIFERERRYAELFGPDRMNRRGFSPEGGSDCSHPSSGTRHSDYWYNYSLAWAWTVFCRNFCDAPPAALAAVFNRPLKELEKLLVRSRNLIMIDWNFNREVNGAVKDCLCQTRG